MKLTRLELSGFKSFADDIVLPFEEGVTAIVGPNGCGKSNVSDAVRWVLGEQRARMLRGSKMDEVIFQGSTGRKPTNVAEVSLYFDNSEGVIPIAFTEVVVTRRLSRSGQSDYLINNSPVRLRDVQDLMRGTGLAADSGVVIESGMIDRLLSDKAEERRSLFEEAAGIGLYRDRRNSTERRLDRTRDDLQRLDDLISEIQTQVRSLARQKGKAERHKRFTNERFQIVMTLTRHDLELLDRQERELRAQFDAHGEEIPRIERRLAAAEEDREDRIQERASAEARRSALDRRLGDLRVELEKLEGDLNLGDERLRHAAARKTRAEAELQDAQEKAQGAQREHEAAARERVDAQDDLQSVQTELDLRSSTEDESRKKVARHRETVRGTGERLQETAERIRTLSGELTAIEAELADIGSEKSQAEVRLRNAEEATELSGSLVEKARAAHQESSATYQRASAGLERARHNLAAALEAETAIQVESRSLEQESAQLSARQEALEELERNRVGLAPGARKLLEQSDTFSEGAIVGPLADFISPASGEAALAERVLSNWIHAVLVRDDKAIDEIREWHSRINPGPLVLLPVSPGPRGSPRQPSALRIEASGAAQQWVTALVSGISVGDAEGTVLTAENGAVFLQQVAESAGPLGRREELDQQRIRLSSVNARLEDARGKAAAAESHVVECRSTLETAGATAETEREHSRETSTALEDAVRKLDGARKEVEAAAEALSRLAHRASQRKERSEEVGRLHAVAVEERKSLLLEMETQDALLEESLRMQEEAQEKRVHWQVEEAQVSARERSAHEREQRSRSEASTHKSRISALTQELESVEQEQSELTDLQTLRREGIAERRTAIDEIEAAAKKAGADVGKAGSTLQQSERDMDATREKLRKVTETIHRIEIELTELSGKRNATVERVEGEWNRTLEELLDETEPAEGDIDAMRQEAEKLKGAIDAIGPVNPLAVEEYEQELERFEFLSSQRNDLVEARAGLMRALKEMDETARTMFMEAFEDIRENYLTVFNTLFEGGTCDLKLAEPDDPLNSEIDIQAAPHGKRTQRIHLLSSGERALVAISLLFAIYLTKPSPFCLLDEVDAPLDDSNVLRFVRLLDEFKDDTQFIVITHNPRTMQVADSVYGVTMQEPGVSKIVGVRLGEVEPVAT